MKSLFYENIHNGKYKGYISEYQLLKEIKANNVLLERLHLYHDFIINLIYYVQTSYLGKEYINKLSDVEGHYSWAFSKVIAEFEEEGISFKEISDIKTYFFEYFMKEFYAAEKQKNVKQMLNFWRNIFTIKSNKDTNEFKQLIFLYQLFDTSFNKK